MNKEKKKNWRIINLKGLSEKERLKIILAIANFGNGVNKRKLEKCPKCGKKMIRAKDSINYATKKWDGHTYKYNCKCFNENLRISIG